MKRISIMASVVLASLLLILAGCRNDIPSFEKGTVTFSLTNSLSKGIAPGISIDTEYYIIEGYGPNNETMSVHLDSAENTYIKQDVSAGSWTFTATAYNSDDIAIGSGSASTTVEAGKNSAVYFDIQETAGKGTFKVIINGVKTNATYTLNLLTAEGGTEPVKSFVFSESDGALQVELSLDNGFYAFEISCSNSLIKLPAIDSVRIVKGDTVTVTYTLTDTGEVSVNIKNEIITTPSLSLSLSYETISSGEILQATAVVSNCDTEGIQYLWYLDNAKLEYTNSSIELAYEDVGAGRHTLTCMIRNASGLIWSCFEEIVATDNPPAEVHPYLAINEDGSVYCIDKTITEAVIPEHVNRRKVTSIANEGFKDCTSLESVTISNSVTSLGDLSFCGCSSLVSVSIPDSVTTVGKGVFAYCTNLKNVSLGKGIKIIEGYYDNNTNNIYGFFSYCTSLTEIVIPDTVTKIGHYTFFNCSALTEITIPDSVISIEGAAFNRCSSLKKVTLSNSIVVIPSNAFDNCTSLTDITIPNKVKRVQASAFGNCRSLEKIIIPNSVTEIEFTAFYGCTSLTEITIPDSVTKIGGGVFYNCSALEKVSLGQGIESLDERNGKGFFEGCTKLSSVTIPDSVTSIGNRAFEGCSSLKSIYIDQEKDSLDLSNASIPNTTKVYWKGESDSSSNRPKSLTLDGAIDLYVVGDVLIPEELIITGYIDEEDCLDKYDNSIRIHQQLYLSEKSKLTCEISGVEGYDYYLEQSIDSTTGITTVFIVIDKEISNPAYLDVTFNQSLVLNRRECRGVYFQNENSQSGLIPFTNKKYTRRLKAEAGTYTLSGRYHLGEFTHWPTVSTPNVFTVNAGQTAEIELTTPVANVCLESQDFKQNVSYKILNDKNLHVQTIESVSEQIKFIESILTTLDYIIHEDNSTFDSYHRITIDVAANNSYTETVETIKPTVIKPSLTIPAGRVAVTFDSTAVMPLGFRFAQWRLINEQDVVLSFNYSTFGNDNSRIYNVGSNCRLEIIPLYADGYSITASSETISDDSGELTLITIHYDKDFEDTAYLSVVYDFEQVLDYTYNTGLCLQSNESDNSCYYFPMMSSEITRIKIPTGSYVRSGVYSPLTVDNVSKFPNIAPKNIVATSGMDTEITISL